MTCKQEEHPIGKDRVLFGAVLRRRLRRQIVSRHFRRLAIRLRRHNPATDPVFNSVYFSAPFVIRVAITFLVVVFVQVHFHGSFLARVMAFRPVL